MSLSENPGERRLADFEANAKTLGGYKRELDFDGQKYWVSLHMNSALEENAYELRMEIFGSNKGKVGYIFIDKTTGKASFADKDSVEDHSFKAKGKTADQVVDEVIASF